MRIQVGKRLRFEIFKRDGFTCQYCGQHPPSVVLEPDHIKPASKGGTNDSSNLVTACFDCNRGKSDILLSSIPESLRLHAQRIKEAEEQLRGYQEIIQSKVDRLEGETWKVVEILECGRFDSRDFNSIKRFIEKLGFHAVKEAMENAVNHANVSRYGIFKYFCGTCWNLIRPERQRSSWPVQGI